MIENAIIIDTDMIMMFKELLVCVSESVGRSLVVAARSDVETTEGPGLIVG
jgi:hypothetical protein